eukprot:5983211-Ditylum_brightwellii.AAC.1
MQCVVLKSPHIRPSLAKNNNDEYVLKYEGGQHKIQNAIQYNAKIASTIWKTVVSSSRVCQSCAIGNPPPGGAVGQHMPSEA